MQALELRLEIAALLACGGPGALDQGGLQPGCSFAHPSFFGHSPAQEIRCPCVGKRLMSVPISARTTQAARSLIPGGGLQPRDRIAKWVDMGVDLLINLGNGFVDGVNLPETRAESGDGWSPGRAAPRAAYRARS